MKGLALRLARPATAAILVAALLWAWGVHALWDSTFVPSLHLQDLQPSRFFSDSFLQRSASYERFLAIDSLLAMVALLIVLGLYVRRGHRLMRESAAGRVGTGMLLAMLGLAIVWLAELPFGLAAVWWQRRYEVSHQSYLAWIFESFFSLGGTFLFVCVGLGIAMGLAGVLRRWWWAVAAPVFVGLALLFTLVSPYLIPNTTPLQDQALLAEARKLERIEGLDGTRVRVQDVHRFTTAPNAESAGLGGTRTVVMWDTLVNGKFSRPQIGFVIAHEFGHLAHNDPLKLVGWLALFLLPATGLIAFFTRGRGGLARPEAIPVALFVLVVLQLIASPFFNVVSRHQEAAADWTALTATHDPVAARAVLRRLATKSLHSPDPPSWSYALNASHPSIMQRIAMTYAWEEREGHPRGGH